MDTPLVIPSSKEKTSPILKHKGVVLGLIAFGLFVFFIMWYSVKTESLFFVWDEPVNRYFLQLRESASPEMTSLARAFGKAGSQGITAVSILLMIYWVVRRQFRRFWFMFAAMTGVELLWLSVVFGIGRPRPVEVRTVADIILPSFPSGHVMLFSAFVGTILYLFYLQIKRPAWRILLAVVVLILLLATAYVRLYFTAHYLTDVIAGYGLGLAWTVGVLTAVDYFFLRLDKKAA